MQSHLYLHVFAALLPHGLLLFSLPSMLSAGFFFFFKHLRVKEEQYCGYFFGVLTIRWEILKPCSAAALQQEGDRRS